MSGFDFGSLVDDQFRGIRRGYKFGQAFNEDTFYLGYML